MDSHKMWIEQCGAAGDTREEFGLDKALGYPIGENLILRAGGFREVRRHLREKGRNGIPSGGR